MYEFIQNHEAYVSGVAYKDMCIICRLIVVAFFVDAEDATTVSLCSQRVHNVKMVRQVIERAFPLPAVCLCVSLGPVRIVFIPLCASVREGELDAARCKDLQAIALQRRQ
jgi:hypothetical protein